jgi:hypothetical protein
MADTRPRLGKRTIPAEEARQGEIILRTPLGRIIFLAGLAGSALLAIAIWPHL